MVPLLDIVDSHMQARPIRSEAAYFFTCEEIRVLAQRFHGADGIMIGDGYQAHSSLFENFVDRQRVVIAFLADPIENRN